MKRPIVLVERDQRLLNELAELQHCSETQAFRRSLRLSKKLIEEFVAGTKITLERKDGERVKLEFEL